MLVASRRCGKGVAGCFFPHLLMWRQVTKSYFSRRELESSAIEGDSPVYEKIKILLKAHLSTAGLVESCGNPGRPLSKAKYQCVTDSELVP